MTGGPSIEPGLAVLPAGAIAVSAAGLLGAVLVYAYTGQTDVGGFVSLAVFAMLVAFAIGGLAAPPLAKRIVGNDPLSWGNAALTGALAPLIPAVAILLVKLPLAAWADEEFTIAAWPAGLAMLAACGAVGGLVFRALYGARRFTPQ